MSRLPVLKPRATRLSTAELVRTSALGSEPLPLLIEPAVPDVDLVGWASANRPWIDELLLRHGALLLRGFGVTAAARFEAFAAACSGELLHYQERAAPRKHVTGKVFTSTEFNADHPIPLHHEMSYSHQWPSRLFFFCDVPAERGGRTPLADDRRVFGQIDAAIKERFTRKKVMYVRNYSPALDPWEEVFQTNDRAEVEAYCQRWNIAYEWRDGERLRTRQVRQAVATHPVTGDVVWFNHAHMFHVSNVAPELRASLLETLEGKEEDLPRNAFYGDGTPLEASVLDEIRAVHRQNAVSFPWQAGDVLMVDNFLVIHGREPYGGPRRVLVTMADLYTNPEF